MHKHQVYDRLCRFHITLRFWDVWIVKYLALEGVTPGSPNKRVTSLAACQLLRMIVIDLLGKAMETSREGNFVTFRLSLK